MLRRAFGLVLRACLAQGAAAQSIGGYHPPSVRDVVPDCEVLLAQDGDGSESEGDADDVLGNRCVLLSTVTTLALQENCAAHRRGEPLPLNEAPWTGLTGAPPSRDRAIQAFLDWARSHPEALDARADDVFPQVVAEVFPCTP